MPSARLAWLLVRHTRHKVLAMIASYFDESGTDRKSRSTDFAGYAAPASEWAAFEERWRVFLARDPAIPYYHASECLSGKDKIFVAIPRLE
jgi:hypothetical protein